MRLFYLHYPQGGLLVCFLVHIDSFCYYLTSNAPAKTQEAEENQAKEEKAETVQGATGQTARAVEQQTTSTEAVAYYCSFSSREYFHRLFRQHQGMTPSQYQQTTGGAAAK